MWRIICKSADCHSSSSGKHQQHRQLLAAMFRTCSSPWRLSPRRVVRRGPCATAAATGRAVSVAWQRDVAAPTLRGCH